MQKKKIIVLVIVLLLIGAVVYFVFFSTPPEAAPWDELTDEEKLTVFDEWFAGQGSVYIKPGTNEFFDLIDEVKALYEAAGLPWDEEAFIQMYEEANGAGSYSQDEQSTGSSTSGGEISVSNRPGTNEYNG